jgi:DNA polymerase-3 subunit beta
MTKVRTEQLQEALALGLRVGRTDGTTQVQLEGHGDTLRVSVNVLGDWYQRRLGVADGISTMRAVVSLRHLAAVVGALHGETTTLDCPSGARRLSVASGAARFGVPLIDADLFDISVACKADDLSPQWDKLSTACEKVAHAVGHDETRYTLCGVSMSRDGDRLALMATDGHRLALTRTAWPVGLTLSDSAQIIVSADATRMLRACAKPEGRFMFDCSSIHYADNSQALVMRLIDGQSPDWRSVIDINSTGQIVTVESGLLVETTEQARAIGGGSLRVKATVAGQSVTLTAADLELGELVVTHDAAVVGAETQSDIGLNPTYLREAVKAVGGASVDLRLIAKEEPILVLPHGETVATAKTVCVIMPVRV